VLIDIALKASARALLRGKADFSVAGGAVRLGYVENASGFGFDQSRLLARYGVSADDSFVVSSLFVYLALALIVHLWHRLGWKPWLKTAAAAAAYFGIAFAALCVLEGLRIELPPYLRGMCRALGPLAIAFVLFVEVERPYYALLSLLYMAGTLGNCLSLLLPPFLVIDYFGIYRPSIGGYVYANLADAYLVAAMALVVLIPAYLAIRRLHGRS
jgi:lipoprotein signal peptidase